MGPVCNLSNTRFLTAVYLHHGVTGSPPPASLEPWLPESVHQRSHVIYPMCHLTFHLGVFRAWVQWRMKRGVLISIDRPLGARDIFGGVEDERGALWVGWARSTYEGVEVSYIQGEAAVIIAYRDAVGDHARLSGDLLRDVVHRVLGVEPNLLPLRVGYGRPSAFSVLPGGRTHETMQRYSGVVVGEKDGRSDSKEELITRWGQKGNTGRVAQGIM